jgi:hypothetical protein
MCGNNIENYQRKDKKVDEKLKWRGIHAQPIEHEMIKRFSFYRVECGNNIRYFEFGVTACPSINALLQLLN